MENKNGKALAERKTEGESRPCRHVQKKQAEKKTLNMYLPVASVKSLIPPPTVSGTNTFSDVYLKTYKACKISKSETHRITEVIRRTLMKKKITTNLSTCIIGKSPRGKSRNPVMFKKLI